MPHQLHYRGIGVKDLTKAPRGPRARSGEHHLTEGPLKRKIVAGKCVVDDSAAVVPSGLPTIVIGALIDRELQIGDHRSPAGCTELLYDPRFQLAEVIHLCQVAE